MLLFHYCVCICLIVLLSSFICVFYLLVRCCFFIVLCCVSYCISLCLYFIVFVITMCFVLFVVYCIVLYIYIYIYIHIYIYIYQYINRKPGLDISWETPLLHGGCTPWGRPHPPGRPPFCCPDTWAKGCDMEFRRSSKFLKRFFIIISKCREFWTILSASILTFSCGYNGMSPYI